MRNRLSENCALSAVLTRLDLPLLESNMNKKIIIVVITSLTLLLMVFLVCSRCGAEKPDGVGESVGTTSGASTSAGTDVPKDTSTGATTDPSTGENTAATTETTLTIPEDSAPETGVVDIGLTDNPFGTAGGDEANQETDPTEDVVPDIPTESPVATNPTGSIDPSEDTEDELTYEEYMSLSAAEQKAYRDTFESIDAYFVWFNSAKAEYDAQNSGIDVGDGPIDLGGN